MDVQLIHWIIFNVIVVILIGLELWRFVRSPHAIGIKEALINSAGWISIALFFNVWLFFAFGQKPALDFLTGYLLEKSLSVDNLFIFLVIFNHFKVPEDAKHQVLFYGILGAIIFRSLLIWGGISLIKNFHWVLPLFGIFLIIAGIKLIYKKEEKEEIENSFIYQKMKQWIPFTPHYQGSALFIGKYATPLLAVLILIEISDLIFALDSVPAIMGITTEPFIVYTSNILAILGLRSLFFAVQGVIKAFYLLHYALGGILIFIGCKMAFANFIHVPTWITFLILISSIALAMIFSILYPQKNKL